MAVTDLNRDHWPDIVVLAQAPRRQPDGTPVKSMVMKVFWGGRLGRRQIRELPMSVAMKAADFDADGARDIAVLTAENEIRIFWASSEPSAVSVVLNSSRIPLSGPAAGCLAAGDIDGDGRTDLVAGTLEGTLYTIAADAHRKWSHPVRGQAAPASHISGGDLDGDGRADLAAAVYQGTSSFSTPSRDAGGAWEGRLSSRLG